MQIKNPQQVFTRAKNCLALTILLVGVLIVIYALKTIHDDALFVVGFVVAGVGSVLHEVEVEL